MAKESKSGDERPIIIIKKVKKVAAGHHGGAWKVAYADFVTAMMAFFLLLWLLGVTTSDAKKKIADYFAPTAFSASTSSGSGGVLGGTTIAEDGAMTNTTTAQMDVAQDPTMEDKLRREDSELDTFDEKTFKETEANIRKELEEHPEMQVIAQNLLIDMTPEGLRIQIVDQEGKPMFEIGKATPLPLTIELLKIITKAVKELPNKISIRGHTDSVQYAANAEYTNWELSSDRANASRRVMLGAGLDVIRIENVQGKADREPLVPNQLDSPRNRRITILLLKQSLVRGIKRAEEKFKNAPAKPKPPEPKKREEGVIYFP